MRLECRRTTAVLPIVILALLILTNFPQSGWAHAVLMESVPADGASLDSAPPTLALRFNEPVTPIRIQLLDQQGRGHSRSAKRGG